jgi:integrase
MKGSITQRTKGSWQLRYDGPADATGKRSQVNETVRGTRREAESVLRERLTAIEAGNYVARSKETVGQFMESWLEVHAMPHTAPKTLDGYRGNVSRYIIPCLGATQLQALTPRCVQGLHRWMLDKGLSNQSVTHAHRVLSKALNDATSWGIITKNPASSVSPPRPERKEVEVWDMDSINTFMEASQDSPFHEAFMLALHTGMRRSEITGLRWHGVDLPASTIRVTGTLQRVTGHGLLAGQPKTKTGRRAIALGPTTIDLLHGLRGKQLALQAELGDLYQNEDGHVFTNDLGKPIDSNRLSREFAKVVKRAGLPHATLHGLRHCMASLMLADGASIKTVAEKLGHSNPSLTLDVYSHLLPTIQEQAAEALDKRLAGR